MVRKVSLILVFLFMVSLATPVPSLADGQYGQSGQYGQGTETPESTEIVHEPVDTDLGDVDPLVVVLGLFIASGSFYYVSKKNAQVLG